MFIAECSYKGKNVGMNLLYYQTKVLRPIQHDDITALYGVAATCGGTFKFEKILTSDL